MALIHSIKSLYFCAVRYSERVADSWFLGFAARFTFASVLYLYFFNSFLTKISSGLFGFLTLSPGAFYQIMPQVMAANGGDTSTVGLLNLIIAYAGTYAEFILPTLIVLGLFTRPAAVAMIGFICVQTYVDINFHHADAATIGHMFDRVQNSPIADQRLMWIFILLVPAFKGAGMLSLDSLLKWFQKH